VIGLGERREPAVRSIRRLDSTAVTSRVMRDVVRLQHVDMYSFRVDAGQYVAALLESGVSVLLQLRRWPPQSWGRSENLETTGGGTGAAPAVVFE